MTTQPSQIPFPAISHVTLILGGPWGINTSTKEQIVQTFQTRLPRIEFQYAALANKDLHSSSALSYLFEKHDCGHLLSALETSTLYGTVMAAQRFLLEDDDPANYEYEQQAIGAPAAKRPRLSPDSEERHNRHCQWRHSGDDGVEM